MTPKSKTHPKLFLIDTSSLIFRAFFAIRNLSNSKGLPTNATYGFVTMLLNLIEKHQPDYMACLLDTPKPTFRKEMYQEYKANRGAPPDDLVPQFEQIHRCVDLMRISKLVEPGYEADDLIATLVKKFPDCEIVIVSSDKDLMQLVNDRVKILDTMKNILYGPKEVKDKLGIEPEQVIDYLGLIGDTSDNIPGIPGVGPKTAVDLLKEYKTLENVLAAAPQMKAGRKRDILIEHAQSARLSKQLATVHYDVPGVCQSITLETMKAPKGIEEFTPGFLDFVREMEFKGLEKKVLDTLGTQSSAQSQIEVKSTACEIVLVHNEAELRKCLAALESEPVIAFDTETRGSKITEVEMVGMSLCGNPERAFYIPVRHQGEGTSEQVSIKHLLAEFQKLLQHKTIVAQNLKYDYKILLAEGGSPEKLFGREKSAFDTMLAHYLIDPEEKHGLDALSARYLNSTIGDFEQVLGERADFSLVPLSDAARYGGLDAWATRSLYDPLKAELLKDKDLENLFYSIEMPTSLVLAHMEWNGIAVNPEILERLSDEYATELQSIEKEIFHVVGHPFNLNSPKQLSEILFNKLGLPVIQKTKTGYSTDVRVLETLAPMHPVPALIVRYRELTKLKSTYVDVLPGLIEKDGRVHASFNQAVTATGRLSSSDPNLQNIPIKTQSGRKIRKAFVSGKNCVLVGADYSQIELRLVAHLSGDEALIDAFNQNKDVHRETAAEIFKVHPNDVTDQQRGAAKAINFGLIYGKTPFGLAQELHISRTEAHAYIEAYFKRYHGVKEFMERTLEQARKDQVVRTLFGRKRPIRDIQNKNMGVRNNAERMAMNTPVQGTAADIMKLAMIRAQKSSETLNAKLVLQVHDELVLDVPEQNEKQAMDELRSDMENVAELSVPLHVNIGSGKNWMDL